MQVKISRVGVHTDSLLPTLLFDIQLSFYRLMTAPISISGELRTSDRRTIAFLNEFQSDTEDKMLLKHFANEQLAQKHVSNVTAVQNYNANLTCMLSPKAVEHIELLRERAGGEVHFSIRLLIKSIEIPQDGIELYIQTHIQNFDEFYTISQSDWIRKFAPSLGIGKFLLLELAVPARHNVEGHWEVLYKRASERLNEMENSMKQGEWEMALMKARQFYETLKMGGDKEGHKDFEEELKLLFAKDQHSPQGTSDFLAGIWNFFNFLSKFVHEKDRDGKIIEARPIPTKEDAYFAYALGVGLLNIIGKKTSK